MLKKILLGFVFLFFAQASVLSQEILVNITPLKPYTTADNVLQVGDMVDFIVVNDVYDGAKLLFKKGAPVQGIVTSREENDYYGKEATLCVEQLKAINPDGKWVNLSGIVLKHGNDHMVLLEYVFGWLTGWFTRGGEVFFIPYDDIFSLYLKV